MFTGIVEELGSVRSIVHDGDSAQLWVDGPTVAGDVSHGDSIAVNGVCLTVVAYDVRGFGVDVMTETLARSCLGALQVGDRVNLERATRTDGRFGGHIVQGHIDGTGQVGRRVAGDNCEVVTILLIPGLTRYVVPQGSVTVDGVSLTVVAVGNDWFSVSLIPATMVATTLGVKQQGDLVNIEVDVLAKYVEKLMEVRL